MLNHMWPSVGTIEVETDHSGGNKQQLFLLRVAFVGRHPFKIVTLMLGMLLQLDLVEASILILATETLERRESGSTTSFDE